MGSKPGTRSSHGAVGQDMSASLYSKPDDMSLWHNMSGSFSIKKNPEWYIYTYCAVWTYRAVLEKKLRPYHAPQEHMILWPLPSNIGGGSPRASEDAGVTAQISPPPARRYLVCSGLAQSIPPGPGVYPRVYPHSPDGTPWAGLP